MIAAVAVVFGALIAILGLMGVVQPSRLLVAVERIWRSAWGRYAVASLRVALGVVLLVAAQEARFATALGVIGVLAIIGGLAIPLIGREGALHFIEWWHRQHDTFVRAWSVAAVTVGAFVVYACW